MGLDKFRIVTAWVILGTWVGSIVVDATIGEYDPPVTIHLAMMLVAGALFGPTIAGRHNGRKNGTYDT